jgi:xanthine dehydrogenase YagS FAD-binding subunit
LELLRPESIEAATSALAEGTGGTGEARTASVGAAQSAPQSAVALAGGTELVPLMREGIVAPDTLVAIGEVVPRGIRDGWIGAGTTLGELEVDPQIPAALQEACSLAASPQLRAMGTIGGNLLQATRCWYWRLRFPCRLHGGERCFAREDDRDTTTLEPGELILELDYEPPIASTYLKAMDRQRYAFAIVGVAAARFASGTRLALAGVAPIPWLLEDETALERSTPLPGTAYKVEIAKTLVRRAVQAIS